MCVLILCQFPLCVRAHTDARVTLVQTSLSTHTAIGPYAYRHAQPRTCAHRRRENARGIENVTERAREREIERQTKAPRLDRARDGDDEKNWPAASATFFGDDVVSRGVLCLLEIGTSRCWPSFPASPTPAVLSSEARRPIVTRRPGAEGLGFQV